MTNEDENIEENTEEPSTTKYLIRAEFTIEGLVEKPDVVGALFGQTEGLLSNELDLRELQKSGRVGRIQVNLNVKAGKTTGYIDIPSSLDKVETSILAAAIETVDRIGPCNAKIIIKAIEDIRREKMKKIRERASELLQRWNSEATQESSDLTDEVSKSARIVGIGHFGQLPAGPELNESDTIIIVEGRADIAACLRAGVRNTVAVDGISVPPSVTNLTKKKMTIAFLDGDRGGDLILKELLISGDIDFIARAPVGKEVEDLKPDEIIEHLSNKVPIENASFISEIHAEDILEKAVKRKAIKWATLSQHEVPKEKGKVQTHKEPEKMDVIGRKQPYGRQKQYPSNNTMKPNLKYNQKRPQARDQKRDFRRSDTRERIYDNFQKIPEDLMPIVKELEGKDKQEGIFLDQNSKEVKRIPVATIYDEIKNSKGVTKIVFDGIITQRLLDICQEKNIDILIGARVGEIERIPPKPKYYSFA